MRLSRIQSRVIAAGLLAAFALISALLLERSSNGNRARNALRTDEGSSKSAPPEYIRTPSGVPARQQNSQDVPEGGSKFMLDDFHRVENKNGRKIWEVKAAKGQYFPENSTARVKDAKLWLYKKDGETLRIDAGEAVLKLDGSSLVKAEALDGVRVILNDKVTITSRTAEYIKNGEFVTAPGRVKIKSRGSIIRGRILRGDFISGKFTILKDIDTVIVPEKKQG